MVSVNLTREEQSVVVGSLLGDGYIDKHNSLQIEHGIEQIDYVDWKFQMLRSIAGKSPRIVSRFDARNRKIYRSVRFYTRCVMGDFRRMFYDGNRKIVPGNLSEMLDNLALAVWFMDDGSRGAHTRQGVVFNTSAFTEDEQFHLQHILRDKFALEVNVHHVDKGYQLYVVAASYQPFYNLVSPYVILQMRYKLANPVTTKFRKYGTR